MRARILFAGILVIAAACSRPAADPAADEALDDRHAAPELALSASSEDVPIASDIEVNQPAVATQPEARKPTPERQSARIPEPEPLASDHDGHIDAAPATAAAPAPVARAEAHPKAPDAEHAVEEAEEGGGKPTGVSTGLGPVPDRNWGDTGIIDDPNPVPGMMDPAGGIGRDGAVIVRGGAGGVHDDCAKHPRGGVEAGGPVGPTGGPAVLVNDRDPRRGALINERSPRTSRSPSLPRGGGFTRGGIR